MHGKISYDLRMEDNMSFVEGTYLVPGHDWQVFIFGLDSTALRPVVKTDARWESGVRGIHVKLPKGSPLNKGVVTRILSGHLGITEWEEVSGPDSMQLR